MQLNQTLKLYCLLGLALCATAGGIIGASFENSHILSSDLIPVVLLGGSILLCILILKDVKDEKKAADISSRKKKFTDLIRSEFRSLGAEMRCRTTRLGLLSYFLWATSQYSILILFTDFQIKYTYIVITMMCGYLIGIVILGFCKKFRDEQIIRAGFLVTITSFIVFFIINFFIDDNTLIIAISCFFYTMGNAFLSPSLLSLFSKERLVHQQGKGFGLIVSADGSGFLAGSIIVITLNYLKLQLDYIFLLSFILFSISWIPYIQYEKKRTHALKKAAPS